MNLGLVIIVQGGDGLDGVCLPCSANLVCFLFVCLLSIVLWTSMLGLEPGGPEAATGSEDKERVDWTAAA